MRIAIIGGGISGLTVAYRLADQHDLTLFEAADHLGGHTNTIAVPSVRGPLAIDTGFIVYNERTYPRFIELLDELGVESQPTRMSFSVRCDRTGLEYAGSGLDGLFAQRRNLFRPSFHRLVRDFLRFNREAPALLESDDESLTVGDWFRGRGYSPEFIEQYFLPMGSAVWSCPRSTFDRFPMRFIVAFYQHHGLLAITGQPRWRVISGGSQRYVEAMRRRFESAIRLSTPVLSVRRDQQSVEVQTRAGVACFDHVVFACHADQALRMLGAAATPLERELLSAFPYQSNVAVLHTDRSVLPRSPRAWACWNYHLSAAQPEQATLTYNMNLLQGLTSDEVYCVTLNGEEAIDPRRVIRRIQYQHPIYDTRRRAVQARHDELLGPNRASYCGAYWGNGFHEDGVRSGLRVCAGLRTESCEVASTKA
jgi:predicted NAD/FAD-binding protein